jgi:hypothetical protein
VVHYFDSLNAFRAHIRVADVAFPEVDLTRQIIDVAQESGGEVVDHAHGVAVVHQAPDQM